MKQHLLLNSTRLTTWIGIKLEIENVRRAQLAAGSNPAPMDVDEESPHEAELPGF